MATNITTTSIDTDTLGVTGNATASTIALGGRSANAGNTPLGVNFSSASGTGLQINDTNSGNLGGMLQFYSGSGGGTLRANIQNANNAGVHFNVGTGGSVVFSQIGYVAANALDDYEEGAISDLRIYFDTNLSDTGSTGASYVTATGGIYTKIGRLVTVQFYFSGQYDANQVLLKSMQNLPFVIGATDNGYYGGSTYIPYHRGFSGYYRYNTSTDFSNNINLLAGPGTTNAYFKSWAHSFTSTGYPLMNAGSGQQLGGSLTYMTV